MSWNAEISKQLHTAFHAGDVAEFTRLLTTHPEYRRDEDGGNVWMAKAAAHNKLSMIKALVDLNVDVNEPNDMGDASDPFYEPEGPILQAATLGNLEIVRWLLEHGARINYTVNGLDRCLPLIRAVSAGHLDIVKLLVQHGALVHATWDGVNAIRQAEIMGHTAIRDYLLSLPNA